MSENPYILQVSELTKKVRFMLESELNTVWLCGEISNFIAASSGHWYLSLKDQNAQVRCAMFKGSNNKVKLTPKNGQQVLVRAKVSLYEPRGDFQIIIEQMESAGEGLLRQQFEQLKSKLNQEGLFELAHKKSLPKQINTVGIVTSATGAAVKDIISVMQRRNPAINIIIYPTLVQGELAAQDICKAINLANKRNECDVIIVGRGGGSMEDLWPFNEEAVVRAIYNSTLPIISAVGHEIDTTLSDYVADLRAPTPSAAAELVSSDKADLIFRISQLKQRLIKSYRNNLYYLKQTTNSIDQRLARIHPQQQLQIQQQKVDDLTIRLITQFNHLHASRTNKPTLLQQRLFASSPLTNPKSNIISSNVKLNNLTDKLANKMLQLLANKQQMFVSNIEKLHLVSPLATIARGYTITRNKDEKIIKSKNQVALGGKLTIQLSDDVLLSELIEKR